MVQRERLEIAQVDVYLPPSLDGRAHDELPSFESAFEVFPALGVRRCGRQHRDQQKQRRYRSVSHSQLRLLSTVQPEAGYRRRVSEPVTRERDATCGSAGRASSAWLRSRWTPGARARS